MYRIQETMDEKAVVFFTQEKFFFYPFAWVKNDFFL